MRTFVLEKLVRDEVFHKMLELGQHVKHRILSDDEEFLAMLRAKLQEEKAELAATGADETEELGQVRAVQEQIDLVQNPDPHKTGAFSLRVYVSNVGLEDSDPWAKYYEAHPDRFPERTD